MFNITTTVKKIIPFFISVSFQSFKFFNFRHSGNELLARTLTVQITDLCKYGFTQTIFIRSVSVYRRESIKKNVFLKKKTNSDFPMKKKG